MQEKILAGAVTYRERRSLIEWLIAKDKFGRYELPKTDVKRGESSVSAIIRYLTETLDVKAFVVDEVARTNLLNKSTGVPVEERTIFYFLRQGSTDQQGRNVEWMRLPIALKKLPLVREQKILKTASILLKEWQKKKDTKKGA